MRKQEEGVGIEEGVKERGEGKTKECCRKRRNGRREREGKKEKERLVRRGRSKKPE